ncbi:hypothetical protein [Streptomyces sp. NPDC003327]
MRARRASGDGRAGGALAHLLLVVVLALGVFMMHSTGHPAGSEGGTPSSVSQAHHGSGHSGGDTAGATGTPDGTSHDSGTGMDMTTLCVAS